MSYYGSFGPRAVGVIQRLSVRYTRALDFDLVSTASHLIYTRLSLTLQIYLAKCILLRVSFPSARFDAPVPREQVRI